MNFVRLSLLPGILVFCAGGPMALAQTSIFTAGSGSIASGSGNATAATGLGATAAPTSTPKANLLPKEFAGWKSAGDTETYTAPDKADATAADFLRENGFSDGATGTYVRGDRKLTLKTLRFNDASGAYSAFTFYEPTRMQPATIGDSSGTDGNHVLFFKGNIVVDAIFNKISAMSPSELRELAEILPVVHGANAGLPVIQKYLPKQSYVANSLRYCFGPIGLARTNLNVPPQTVDFHRGAEVAIGQYTTEAGTGTLVLLSYPTPQIAEERRKAFESLRQVADLNFAKQSGFQVKRSGPIVAVTIGDFSDGEAHELLASVNYDADVTWNQNTAPDKSGQYVAKFLISVFTIIGVIIGFALIAGLAFGGIRLLSRHLKGQALDGSDEQEFISLDLEK